MFLQKGSQVTDVRDVIIIGSGPAGYTAALYAARARLNPLVFEGSVTSGGALMKTTDVENFPGFPDGVLGPDLMDAIRKQAERFGAELVPDDVTEVDLTATPKVVKVGSNEHLARTVIIATGSGYRELGVPGEDLLSGHGVSWCATGDGFFLQDHAGPRVRQPEDQVRLGQRGCRDRRRGPGQRRADPQREDRCGEHAGGHRRVRGHRP